MCPRTLQYWFIASVSFLECNNLKKKYTHYLYACTAVANKSCGAELPVDCAAGSENYPSKPLEVHTLWYICM